MAAINPYLNFNGNTEEAFNFYKSVFGGEFLALMRFKDNPECEQMSEIDKERIMHIALPIGNGNALMATDALESMGQKLTFGNNFYIALAPESREEARATFQWTLRGRENRNAVARHVLGGLLGFIHRQIRSPVDG